MSALAPAAPPPAAGARAPRRSPGGAPVPEARPLLPLLAARGLAFALLAGFGLLHWMALLYPAEPGRALLVLGVAGLVALAMVAAAHAPVRSHTLVAVAALVPLLVLALLAGGLGATWLRPRNWGDLAAGVSAALQGLPGVRVPYRGTDEWTRAIIPLGGSLLAVLAAALAFWPRRAAVGRPAVALVALVVLYAVPAVTLAVGAEFLRGAVLALLVVAFLRLERLQRPDAAPAGWLALAAAIGALVVAPALDRPQPWWDYEAWADDTAAARSVAYSWNHSYGPLTWPRDGREMLRVKARFAAYWKAENLDLFDGYRWVRDDPATPVNELPQPGPSRSRWTQHIRVTVRNLQTTTFVAGGFALNVMDPDGVVATPTLDGGFQASRTLHRGDTYTAQVYTPQPTSDQRETAGAVYDPALAAYRVIDVPVNAAVSTPVTFPPFGSVAGGLQAGPPGATQDPFQVRALLARSPLRRTWALSQRLLRGTRTPEDYVQAVLTYLGKGFSYSEEPPPSARTLEGFLFDARQGYCQQFSGAMALLLRMAGIPARVATGFTAGSFDRRAGEYVVRDLDAHSWVEAYYPGYGWVTFDPTPAAAPARSQPADSAQPASTAGRAQPPRFSAGDLPSLRAQHAAAQSSSSPWWAWALAAAGAAGLVALLAAYVRLRRRASAPGPVTRELERALRVTRRPPRPGTTLAALEAAFAAAPAAAGYVRAVSDARFAGRARRPTAAQRRALRRELARGAGLAGRLRAWWALPPGVH